MDTQASKAAGGVMKKLKLVCVAAAAASWGMHGVAFAQLDAEPAAADVTAPADPAISATTDATVQAMPAAAPETVAAPTAAAPEAAAAPVAQDVKIKAGDVGSPLRSGGYFAPMLSIGKALDDPELDIGYGGAALLGYRKKSYALETGFGYHADHGISRVSWKVKTLLFPFESIPFLYGVAGAGASRYAKYPIADTPMAIDGRDSFYTADLIAGLGYMVPLRVGNYEFAIRAEALYELGDRFLERENDFKPDIAAPGTFKTAVLNIGLQLPFAKALPPPPPPKPVEVVAPAAPLDSDGDGVPDDLDKCPGTAPGVKVDANGCPLNPCQSPEAGEKISLEGCGVGDVIVLRGVNFEFDKARLTVNAETILNQVADELTAHPDVTVELAGHTDSLGSDAYNERLSDKRAASVKKYLSARGIAAERMTAVGRGEAAPIDTNETEEGRERNRRVELKVLSGVSAAAVTTEAAPASADAAVSAAAPEAAAVDAVPAEAAAEAPPPPPPPASSSAPSFGGAY